MTKDKWVDPEDKTHDAVSRTMANDGYWCEDCKHFNDDMDTCKAFPDGIPMDLLTGEVRHTEPREGDHEIQFEKKE